MMKPNLYILIGGADKEDGGNGDYSSVDRWARRGGTANWSSQKGARPGDRALIYIQRPHSALIAKAEVLANPVKGEPGDYAYRAKTGRFEMLPHRVSIQDLKREFPKWKWLRIPRKHALVPAKFASRLWTLVHKKASNVQVLISNAKYGKQLIEDMAETARNAYWSAPKLTRRGDTVLFYVEDPVRAIVAAGKALSNTRPTKRKWYEAKIGQVRMLDAQVKLRELRKMFPGWPWVQRMNMFAYVTPERAKALLKRCSSQSPAAELEAARNGAAGGGFGDAKTNAKVEKAAIRLVTRRLKREGWQVRSVERENRGYDLLATNRRSTEIHVEVKGVSGEMISFIMTRREKRKAETDPCFKLMVVTQARSRCPRLREFPGKELRRRFEVTPLNYSVVLKDAR